MIIDCHTHVTGKGTAEFLCAMDRKPFTVSTLLHRMDLEGIDRSVLLPLAHPENTDMFGVAGNLECLAAARKHPDRLLAFCGVDPRAMLNTPDADLSKPILAYREMGFIGIGELCANLPITDARMKNLFHHAGECGMPVLFHLASRRRGVYGIIDKPGLPGLEEVLDEFPKTTFIGHAMAFWAEIGPYKASEREGYPRSPIAPKGPLWRLLESCPNLYGDLSAGSGFNAISRDPKVGYEFLRTFNKKLFFGTDRFTSKNEPLPKIIDFLNTALATRKISRAAFENITHRNFIRAVHA